MHCYTWSSILFRKVIPLENVENMIISYDATETAMNDEEARLLEEAYHRNSYHGKQVRTVGKSELI